MKRKILFIVIIALTLIKLKLAGVGFFSSGGDEIRYFESINALIQLKECNLYSAIQCIYSTQGRPGDVIVNIIPASMQYVAFKIFDPELTEDKNIPFFIFNFLIYCCILLVHFKFSKLFLKDITLALLSVLFYSCLTNSYLYLRHALPYDTSLLLFYLIIYKISKISLKSIVTIKQSFIWGGLSFFAFTIYQDISHYSL